MFGMRWIFSHGYLAVDFFFMLSGFVLAHAYEARLRTRGSFLPFLRDRIIRLHPLLLLSIVPGAVMLIAGAPQYRFPLLTLAAAASPFPAFWEGLQKFPLNQPSWSLFWELAVNIAFALAAPWLRSRVLGAVIAIAVTGAIWLSLSRGGFVIVDMRAGMRALAGFAIGVMLLRVHRAGRFRADRLGAAAAPLLLASLALVPALPWLVRIYDPVAVFLLFPLIVLASAGRTPRFPAAARWLGELSYPLYVLHGPVLSLTRDPLNGVFGNPAITGLVQLTLSIALTWAAWRLYDAPLRAALRRRFGSG